MLDFLTLDAKGVAAAIVVGVLILALGQGMGPYFLGVILLFLVLSGLVTWVGRHRKMAIGVYQKYRSWRNVVANGAMPVLIAGFYYLNSGAGIVPANFIVISYVASVAAITADKFSSELGVLAGRPMMLLTMKMVRRGTSGAVTAAGVGAGLLGSLIIGSTLLSVIGTLGGLNYGILLVVVIVSGLAGNITDTVFGYFEEMGIGNKFTSNFACSFIGWLISMPLLLIL
ncbi:MAG: DUF92 domain-containing protein [Candidatus Micrarchaeota archaeon]|nr:DUF92 domain-containing protein [Candidatus Micrarchaeota archaeon]MDE1804336.1 DUF92 domain-containing protein [Candidatus Micrarchaeota archaeon]MDE1846559.1 DUF92 domain-containing protein [Candidatus Micrarchaeota archaeon]